MTSAVADYEVDAALDGDRFVALAPARLGPGRRTVVVQRLGWVDAAGWDRLRPVLEAVHSIGGGTPVAELLEAGFADGEGAWVVSADVGRSTLAEGPSDRRTALTALSRAAEGAHALHEVGVVHAGIRPATVHRDGTLDLPDLGPARATEGRVLDLSSPTDLDTVDPAWARGGHPTRETDLYALGATLQRVASGSYLHPDLVGDEAIVALQRVMFEPPQIDAGLDPELAATVAACVAADPTSRPPSARALAGHLATLADGQ